MVGIKLMSSDNNTTMSAADQAELERLLQLDSANMPTSMAVNQEMLASDNSVAVSTPVRSKYFGVYNNKGNNADKFAFRSALRLGSGDNARWMNLGYFNCEHTAAIAYNVAAVNMFGGGAFLNPVDDTLCNVEEYTRFKELRASHIISSAAKVKALHAEGKDMRYVDLDREAAPAVDGAAV